MRNPFIAVDAGADLRARARALRRSWEAAMGGGQGDVRPVIERSWRRLIDVGIDPRRLHPRRALTVAEVQDARAATPLWHVIDDLRGCLGRFADDAEHVMVLVDGEGRILWVEGHNRVRQRADGIEFREGMLWTEDSAGTNAIGTALAIDHPVQIFSAEHFLANQHPWWCSAAPIHDPISGTLLGVVDLSGPLRTAHPHSLALVMAAANLAEQTLAHRQQAADERLRRAFAELAPRRGRRALVAADGRVLAAQPAGWLGERIPPPSEGRAILPGAAGEAEPFEDGSWIVTAPSPLAVASRDHVLSLRLLGRGPFTASIDDRQPILLSLRHAEVLALLAIHRDGLTCEQLTCELYGEPGNQVTTRAEMSRLRRLLGPVLAARPYRLSAEVRADFLEIERRLAGGDTAGCLSAYPGPLLIGSHAPRIEQARGELEAALARAARGSPACLWRWLGTEGGRQDEQAMAAFIRAVPAGDPRRPIVAARLRSLQKRRRPAVGGGVSGR